MLQMSMEMVWLILLISSLSCWCIRHKCRRTFSTSTSLRNAHCYRGQTVAIRCTALRPHGYNLTTRYSVPTATPNNVDTQRDGTLAKLPESVQPRDVDTLPFGKGCRCYTAYLCREWNTGPDVDTRTSSCRVCIRVVSVRRIGMVENAFGEPVASGVYFYTLTAGDFSATRKLLIRK